MARRLVPFLLAASLLAILPVGAAQAQAPLGPPKRDGVWGQTYSDLKPAPDVRFGTLPNGLRYALMRNATPPHQVSLRLRIGSGSLEERDDQQGLAHFLEHMAFKGSKKVPGGDMIQILQRLGLQFGPDTNAFTSFDQTVFMLDLPQNDARSVDTGLMLLREIGGELTLAQSAMDPERGVVLSEERLRDSPAYQSQKAQFETLLAGQRVPQRWPIGLTKVIQAAPVSLMRQFYEAWYRPENATVVAVGDFDLDAMEAKIRSGFSDWKASAPTLPEPDLGAVEKRGETVSLFVKPGAPLSTTVAWLSPYDPTADTAARERRDTIEALGLAVLNRRLETLAQGANPPFTVAQASRDNILRSARATTLSLSGPPGSYAAGLTAAVLEARRLVQYGVTPAELAREIVAKRTEMAALAQGESTRRTPDVANAIVSSTNDDEVFTGPSQNLANFDRYVSGLTPAQVDAAMRAAFSGEGPVVAVSSPGPVPGGEAAVKAVLDKALSAPVAPPASAAAKAWPYRSFGPAGRVVSRAAVADLGLTQVRFANGVRLTVKPTTFTKDQVLVGVRIGDGLLSRPKDRPTPVWLAYALTLGGTRELTADEIEKILADRVTSASFAVGEDAFALQGTTRPQDLATEMQLLAAYVSRPGFRPEAVLRIKGFLADQLPQIESTPESVLARDLGPLIHDGDARFQPLPTAAELAAVQPGDLKALAGPALASGPIAVTVVGDVTPEAAIAAVASTLGALPARDAPAKPTDAALAVRFPSPSAEPKVLIHKGRADQAVAYVAWPADGFYADPKRARQLTVAAQVLETRLTELVRMKEGATYSPDAASSPSQVFPTYGYVQAQVETPPAKIASFYADVDRIAADMRAAPPSADELERAKAPTVETLLKARQTNAWWLGVLGRAQSEPRQLDAIRSQVPDVQAVTAADVQSVSRRYLTDDKAWKLIVRAADPAPGLPEQTPISPTPKGPAPAPGRPQPSPTAPDTKTAPATTPALPPPGAPVQPR